MQTVHENRIYSLKIVCGESYPDQPPYVQFVSRVNLPFVSQVDGKVDPTKLPVLAHWNRNSSIETVLVEIRRCVRRLKRDIQIYQSLAGRWDRLTTANSHSLRKAVLFNTIYSFTIWQGCNNHVHDPPVAMSTCNI